MDPLDNPLWHALSGPQRPFAEGTDGVALRYQPAVSIFSAVPDHPSAEAWTALADLVGPGGVANIARVAPIDLPGNWEKTWTGIGLQMVAEDGRAGDGAAGDASDEVVVLGAEDVPAMLDLVAQAQPGPFLERTIELGTYLGIRNEGTLVAMAGQRMRLDGYVEISAVCTDAAHRGRGYAAALVRALIAEMAPVRAILHVRKDNVAAIRVYERLGFIVRREFEFGGYRVAAG